MGFDKIKSWEPCMVAYIPLLDLGKMNIYNGNSQSTSSNLGVVYPVTVGANSFYSSTINDDLEFMINYPSQRQVTVTLNRFDSTTAITDMPNYCLYLSLRGVPDIE